MSNLNVVIKGISLCYFDREIENWRIFIPKIGGDHPFNIQFVTKQTGTQDVVESFEVEPGSKITLINDGVKTPGTIEPVLLTDTLDISSFHREDLPLVDDPQKYAAFVTLSGFSLESAPASETSPIRFYQVWKTRPGSKVLFKEEIMTHSDIMTTLVANAGSRSSVKKNGNSIIDLDHTSGVDYEIIFDNDCHLTHTEPHPQTDFRFYYNIIDVDKLIDPCKYEIVPVPGKCRESGCDSAKVSGVIMSPQLQAYLNN